MLHDLSDKAWQDKGESLRTERFKLVEGRSLVPIMS